MDHLLIPLFFLATGILISFIVFLLEIYNARKKPQISTDDIAEASVVKALALAGTLKATPIDIPNTKKVNAITVAECQ